MVFLLLVIMLYVVRVSEKTLQWDFSALDGGFQYWGTQIAGWLKKWEIRENPKQKCMMTGGTPHFRKPPYLMQRPEALHALTEHRSHGGHGVEQGTEVATTTEMLRET